MLLELTNAPYAESGYAESGFDTTDSNRSVSSIVTASLAFAFYATMLTLPSITAVLDKTSVLSSSVTAGPNSLQAYLSSGHTNDITNVRYSATLTYDYDDYRLGIQYVDVQVSATYQELFAVVDVLEDAAPATVAVQDPSYLYAEVDSGYIVV